MYNTSIFCCENVKTKSYKAQGVDWRLRSSLPYKFHSAELLVAIFRVYCSSWFRMQCGATIEDLLNKWAVTNQLDYDLFLVDSILTPCIKYQSRMKLKNKNNQKNVVWFVAAFLFSIQQLCLCAWKREAQRKWIVLHDEHTMDKKVLHNWIN